RDGARPAGVGGGDVLGRVADDDHFLGGEGAPRQGGAAGDGHLDQLSAKRGVGAVAAEAEASPQVAALQLDARAVLQVAGGEADGGAVALEAVEHVVDGGLDV